MSGNAEGDGAAGQPAANGVAPSRNDGFLAMPRCDQCDGHADLRGRVGMDVGEAGRRAVRLRAWRERGSPADQRPPLVQWQVWCAECATRRDRRTTWSMSCERVRTERRLLRVSLDLMDKPWIRQTNWRAMALRILAAQRG